MIVPDLERLGTFLLLKRHYEERNDVVISSFHVILRLTFRLGDGDRPLILCCCVSFLLEDYHRHSLMFVSGNDVFILYSFFIVLTNFNKT